MASAEKALADTVASLRDLTTREAMEEYLLSNLRLADLNFLRRAELQYIALAYSNPRVNLLLEMI
jgi:hypothetical protein